MSSGQSQPKRSVFQVRKKDPRAGRRDPYYSPERDFAHVGPYLLRGAMLAMDEESWEPWLQEFNAANDITVETIMESKAPIILAQAMNLIIKSATPPAAMEEVGFDKLSPAMQMLFYSRLGQVLLAAIWAGVKDVSRPDSDPPIAIEEFLDDVNEAMAGFLETKNEPNSSRRDCGDTCARDDESSDTNPG